MRVTRLGTTVVNAGRRNWVVVETRGLLGAIEELAPLVAGQDPRRIEHLWQRLPSTPTSPNPGTVGSTKDGGVAEW